MSSVNSKKKIVKLAMIAAIIVAVCAGISMAWESKYPSGTWRYKITINIDTPDGVKTGSAVREVTVRTGQLNLPGATPHKIPKGEAVVVDLGKGQLLFALTSFDDYQIVFRAFPYDGGGTTVEGIEYYSHLKNAKTFLVPEQLRFVRFKNINDPKTVEEVKGQNLEASFGKGYKFNSASIEMTGELVTWGIEKYLPWLRGLKANLDGSYGRSSNKLSNALDVGNFRKR
ncbi:MAG: hypothetical protein DI586_06165 [Micavibrio aeruginosavorus]|uniref:Uncharacterized protein n=1 Tax=Micavibrio aeruginosavorus TaxID=349221 RepID=A0A2W5FI21_9BACT|nr:MAG: hypothetical protein DI586_06165 [Micavibrio aeruginosavorus]